MAAGLALERVDGGQEQPESWWFAVTRDGVAIGHGGYRREDGEHRVCELSFRVAPAPQGDAFSVVRALVEHLFGDRNIHRLVAPVDADDEVLGGALEANGFRREGHLVESRWSGSEWRSVHVFALLDRQYTARRAGQPEWHDELHWGDLEFLDDRIYEFNRAATGYHDGLGFTGLIRDESGGVIAGVCGFTWGHSAKIVDLWVHQACRGKGLGLLLLNGAEGIARRRDAKVMVLDSHTFQAPDFYQRHGYAITGVTDDFPLGHGSVALSKRLDEESP